MLKEVVKKIFSVRYLYFYILYWIIYVLFFSIQRSTAQHYFLLLNGLDINYMDSFRIAFLTNLAYLPGVVIVTHLVVNYILPEFYFTNRFYLFSLLVILVILFYPVVQYIERLYIVDPFIFNDPDDYSLYSYSSTMLIFVFGMAPLAGHKIAIYLRDRALLQQKMEQERLEAEIKLKEAELKLLKSQIHPHFLFNTLNNLYSLSLEKSDRAPDLIIRLADMLSYIIYDCNSEKVPLTKEVDFLNSFIELQKVRYDSCDIHFAINGDLNNKQIAPMILHTFIDNSFKHGPDKDSGNSWIKISLGLKEEVLFFTVINSTIKDEMYENKASGIGISNAMKRLNLIYPERHDLVINHSSNRYSVFLKIEL